MVTVSGSRNMQKNVRRNTNFRLSNANAQHKLPYCGQFPNAWITSYFVTMWKLPASSFARTAPFSLLIR